MTSQKISTQTGNAFKVKISSDEIYLSVYDYSRNALFPENSGISLTEQDTLRLIEELTDSLKKKGSCNV